MSNSNAAAIRRRASIQPPPTIPSQQPIFGQQQQQQPPQPPVQTKELTLPQVIALVDTRLVNLETFMKETKSAKNNASDDEEPTFASVVELNTVINEFNNRFEILATEINTLKDLLLKLQTFTMEVNQVLFNERLTGTLAAAASDETSAVAAAPLGAEGETFQMSASPLDKDAVV